MMNPIGFGIVAIAATASFAMAGGDEEKNKPATPSNSASLERLGNTPQDAKDIKVSGGAGKGITFTSGDDFSLTIKNRVQAQYRFLNLDSTNPASNGGAQDVSTFNIKRARTSLKGNIYSKDIQYYLQTDWTDTGSGANGSVLKDAWLMWWFYHQDKNSIGLRMGQQKTLFGREATASSFGLEFVDRGLANRIYANSRSRGAMVQGAHNDGKLHWSAGAFNTDSAAASGSAGEEANNPDNELDYVFTARFDGAGDMGDESYQQADLDNTQEMQWSVGGGLQINNHRAVVGAATRDIDGTCININGCFKYKGWHVMGDVFLRSDEPDVAGSSSTDSTGWQAGGSYTFAKREGHNSQWGVGARYSMIKLEDPGQVMLTGTPLGTAEGDMSELSVVVSNYYHKHNLKTQVMWTLQDIDPTGGTSATNHILELQVTFAF